MFVVGALLALAWLLFGRDTTATTAGSHTVTTTGAASGRIGQMSQAVHPTRQIQAVSSAQRPSVNLATKNATATQAAPASTVTAPRVVAAPAPVYAPPPTYAPTPAPAPAPVYVPPSTVAPSAPAEAPTRTGRV